LQGNVISCGHDQHVNALHTVSMSIAQQVIVFCRFNFAANSNLILAGTIQFASSIQLAKQQLASDFPSLVIPQSKPLSPGQPHAISPTGSPLVCVT